jgi:hypothetical protein
MELIAGLEYGRFPYTQGLSARCSCFARLIHALADRRSHDQARGGNSNVHVGPEAARTPKITARKMLECAAAQRFSGSLHRWFERFRSTRLPIAEDR